MNPFLDVLDAQAWRHWRLRDRIVVVPLGADVSTFGPHRRSREMRDSLLGRLGGAASSKIVLFAGRLSAEKDLALLVPAVRHALTRGCDLRLVVAGDGPMREALEREARESLPGRSVFLGHVVRRDELSTLVASVDAFVHTNPREPFGIAPFEALVSGVPVVLPRSGGVLAYATDETAWLVRPGPIGLASGLLECFTRPNEAARRSANAVAMAPAWSWSGVASRYCGALAAIDHRRRTEWPDKRAPGGR